MKMINVKKAVTLVLAAFLLSMLSHGQLAAGNESFTLPRVDSVKLDNGTSIYSIRDDLPQLVIVASFGYGRLFESAKTAGMADCVARMLTVAGSEKYPGTKLHEKIDSMGGTFSVAASWENTVVVLQVLQRFEKEAFDIVRDLLVHPNFNEKHWEMARSLVADDILRKYDDPANIAFEKTREIIFRGEGYGSVPTAKKVQSYGMKDLREAWERYYTGGNLIVGISSPSESNHIAAVAGETFASLPVGEKMEYSPDRKGIDQALAENVGRVFLYPRDLPQATVVVGTVAPDIHDDGHYSLDVMNYILGAGSFNSHLMREIRVKRGLAYAVASVYRARNRTGVFLAFAQTKNEEVDTVLSLLLENIQKVSRDSVLPEELDWAKNSINNSYIFNFDTNLNVLNNYIETAYYGLPGDYFSRYTEKISSVSIEDIRKYSGEMFKPGLIKVVIGKKDLAAQLEKYGQVVILPEE